LPQVRLAARANVGEGAIRRYEDGLGIAATLNLTTVRSALELVGVEFIAETGGGAGVRLTKAAK
jgi:hypothetical protein